jgi:hypothetical protein
MKFITVCCECRKVKTDNNTWRVESYNPKTASHGYCDDCAAEMMEKIAEMEAILKEN